VVDWLPNRLLKGTILGKIASIKDWAERTLPFKPGAIGPLSAEDKARFRAEAITLLGVKKTERKKWIDEYVEREMGGITAKDVLSIWNSVIDVRTLSPDLYNYVAGLNVDAKKLIVRAALKGQVAEELKQFIKKERVLVGRKEEVEIEYTMPSEADIRKKFADLIKEEIRKRRLGERLKYAMNSRPSLCNGAPLIRQSRRKHTLSIAGPQKNCTPTLFPSC